MASLATKVPTKTPVFFVSHGGPNLLDDVGKPGDFYSWFGNYLKNELKPKAIVIISAHWQGEGKGGVFGMCENIMQKKKKLDINKITS